MERKLAGWAWGFLGVMCHLVNVLVVERTEMAPNVAKILLTWEKNAELASYCITGGGFSHAYHYWPPMKFNNVEDILKIKKKIK